MNEHQYIPLKLFCEYHNVEISVVFSLMDMELFTIVTVNNEPSISIEEIGSLESIIRLHNDLEINAEGLHAIVYLQNKLKEMQAEMSILKNRLRFYEP